MKTEIPESDLKVKLLSIYDGIDKTCRKVGSRLQPNAAGEVHFFDPHNGPYKFQTIGLSRRSEMLAAIREGWTPCGFIVRQMAEGRSALYIGTFTWIRAGEECVRYVEERVSGYIKNLDAAEAVYKNIVSS